MSQPIAINPLDPSSTDTTLYADLAKALAAIPDGHTHAILLDTTYTQADGPNGWISYLQKAPDGWNVMLDGGYDKPHGLSAGVLVGKSW